MEPISAVTAAAAAWNVLKPYLGIMASKGAEKVGESVPEKVAKLWGFIRGEMKSKPSASEAVEDLLAEPNDDEIQAAFRLQLRKLMEHNQDLLTQIQSFIRDAESQANYTATLSGSGAIAQGTGAQAIGAGGVSVGKDLTGNVSVQSQKADSKDQT